METSSGAPSERPIFTFYIYAFERESQLVLPLSSSPSIPEKIFVGRKVMDMDSNQQIIERD